MTYYARVGGDPALIMLVAGELQRLWDPERQFQAPDSEYTAQSHALAILGMLATDGNTAAVKGYLRRAETIALGAPRTTSEERATIAEWIWRAMVDASVSMGDAAGSANEAN